MEHENYICSLKKTGMVQRNSKKAAGISGSLTIIKKRANFWPAAFLALSLTFLPALQGCRKYLEETRITASNSKPPMIFMQH